MSEFIPVHIEMIRDWDLWPLYLDRGWVDAEDAERIAREIAAIHESVMAFVDAVHAATPSIAEMGVRLAAAMKHQPVPTARR